MDASQRVAQLLPVLVERIKNGYAPERVILFGSYAYGQPDAESDIDLLIIKETDKPFHKRWAEVCRLVSDLRRHVAFSPFVFTPEELNTKLEKNDPFFQEILQSGKVLYAR